MGYKYIFVNCLHHKTPSSRFLMSPNSLTDTYKPIEVFTHPFQQTEQQEEFNLGNVVCAIFMGMIFALVPVTLAVDIVYDREVKKRQKNLTSLNPEG